MLLTDQLLTSLELTDELKCERRERDHRPPHARRLLIDRTITSQEDRQNINVCVTKAMCGPDLIYNPRGWRITNRKNADRVFLSMWDQETIYVLAKGK